MKFFAKVLFLVLIFGFSESWGQSMLFSSNPSDFTEDLQKQFSKQLGSGVKPVISAFNDNFKTKLNPEAQAQVIGLFQQLTKKGYRPIEVYRLFSIYSGLSSSADFSSEKVYEITTYLTKSIDGQSSKKVNEILAVFDDFLNKSLLHTSGFNKVYVLNAEYSFGFFDKKQNYFEPKVEVKEVEEKIVDEDIGWGEIGNEEEYDPWSDPSLEVSGKTATNSLETIILPSVKGFYIAFKSVDLALVGPSDSLVVAQTSGAFDFTSNVFLGQSGKVVWNLNHKEASATLDKYFIKVQGSKFIAEQAELNFPSTLNNNVKGVVEFRLENRPKGVESTFPRFKSYRNDAQVNLNMPSFSYYGGISLVGAKVYSSSLLEPYANIVANKGKRNAFEVRSRSFEITDTLITADRVSFVTRFGTDSVSHPAVRMVFNLKENHLGLYKLSKGGFRNSMYSDTFHQVDIRCDAMSWDLNASKLDFNIIAGKTEIPALFESFNYYNPDRIRYLSSAAGYNPLIAAGNIVARKKVNSITVSEMQAATKKEKFFVSNGMLIGHQMGFFDYDPLSATYSLSRKGKHYFFSYLGKTDFDDLVLSSISQGGTGGGNASIDLASKSLDIKGTQDFKFSDSLGISFVPKGQSMQIVGNKVFTFNGEIGVKNFTFYGDFEVQYEQFVVNLKRIDSIKFIPLEIYKKGGKAQLGANILFGQTGTLYLNSPDNKSGRKNLPEYPKLEIPGGALVYFNEKGRKQKFENEVNFKFKPINIDSLNTVNPVFAGVFNSGGIFKPIQENLVVMADTSMGVRHIAKMPYKIYGTETSIKTDSAIVLNKKGISSSGEITHLAGKFKTKMVSFLTDELTAEGDFGKIQETVTGAYFPDVAIGEYDLAWVPEADSMSVVSAKGFEFYNKSSLLTGGLVLRKTGLFGNGLLNRTDSDVKSNQFKFNKSGFLADNSTFNIKSGEKDAKPVFGAKHVDIDFNIQKFMVNVAGQKELLTETYKSELEFPYSSYATTIDKAVWDIKKQRITMEGLLATSVFRSTHPTQFGLKFNGTAATYDLAGMNLKISGVEAINSVDASIVPTQGLVAVMRDGKLEPFKNAKIIADTLNKYHVLTNANVTVNSKLSFVGSADYQFVNVSSDTFNIKLGNFEFSEVSPEGDLLSSKSSNKLSTIARAKVTEKDSIYLSPKMLYKGEIMMLSPFKNLALNGMVLPDLKRYPMLGGSWINYKGNKSEAISINVDNTLKDGGKPLFVGLHISTGKQTDAIYPTFLSAKKSGDDSDIFLATGLFKRDEPNKKFVVAPADPNAIGNVLEFYDDKGIIAMEGKFNLLGSPSKILETVGIGNVRLDSMKYQFATMLKLDFPISIPVTQKLGQNIVKSNLDVGNSDPAILPDSPVFMAKVNQYLGPKETVDYKNKSLKEHVPLHKFSNKFLSTMILSDVNLAWNPISNAYYSVGKIGISNIGDVDVNAMVNGYVEIVKSPATGDEVYVFLEISPTQWYFFVYRSGQLGVTSADEDFNKAIAVPETTKDKKSDLNFVDVAEATRFRKNFLKIYRGMKEEDFAKKPSDPNKLPGTPPSKSPTKKAEEKDGF